MANDTKHINFSQEDLETLIAVENYLYEINREAKINPDTDDFTVYHKNDIKDFYAFELFVKLNTLIEKLMGNDGGEQ